MSDVYVIVEGHTEQTFVRDILAPELGHKGIYLYPALIGKPGHKGGDIRFERTQKDILMFLQQRQDAYISTMFDYFRIEPDRPGKQESQKKTSALDKASVIESATLSKAVQLFPDHDVNRRFIPYIEMYEFEALLFSDASILAEKIGANPASIKAILRECGQPEEINDGPETAPSKRLETLCRGYRKVAMGKTISQAIGVQQIRNRCLHFNHWVNILESLTSS